MKKEIVISEENQKLLDKQGWFYEYESLEGPIANIRTRGLAENLHHMDLQIVLKLEEELVELLLKSVIENIKGGYTYYEGISKNVIEDIEVEFKKFKDDGQDVLRMVLPDEEGRFPSDESCAEPYKQQYIQLEV